MGLVVTVPRFVALLILIVCANITCAAEPVLRSEYSAELNLIRLYDGQELTVAGAQWEQLAPGAYQVVGTQRLLVVRADDSAAGWAESTLGLPTISTTSDAAEMAVSAENGSGMNPLTLPIWVWRRAIMNRGRG